MGLETVLRYKFPKRSKSKTCLYVSELLSPRYSADSPALASHDERGSSSGSMHKGKTAIFPFVLQAERETSDDHRGNEICPGSDCHV